MTTMLNTLSSGQQAGTNGSNSGFPADQMAKILAMHRDSQSNAVIYVVVVLLLYATAMVILMVKYLRRGPSPYPHRMGYLSSSWAVRRKRPRRRKKRDKAGKGNNNNNNNNNGQTSPLVAESSPGTSFKAPVTSTEQLSNGDASSPHLMKVEVEVTCV